MATKRDPHELLLIEEADAWFEYLESTQAEVACGRYDEVGAVFGRNRNEGDRPVAGSAPAPSSAAIRGLESRP